MSVLSDALAQVSREVVDVVLRDLQSKILIIPGLTDEQQIAIAALLSDVVARDSVIVSTLRG